jgi:hypothetical protein
MSPQEQEVIVISWDLLFTNIVFVFISCFIGAMIISAMVRIEYVGYFNIKWLTIGNGLLAVGLICFIILVLAMI